METIIDTGEKESNAIRKTAIDIVQQSIDLVNKLQDDQYTHCSIVMPCGTIGKHIR
jgi:hypothetical protein